MEIVVCAEPGCGTTAEIVDRWVLESTDGPIEHARTRCLDGHVLTSQTERLLGLPPVPTRVTPSGSGGAGGLRASWPGAAGAADRRDRGPRGATARPRGPAAG